MDNVWENPQMRAAIAAGDTGAIVRLRRKDRGLTLVDLGKRIGYSHATISRLETGRQPLRDVELLRALAVVLDIPARYLGLATKPTPTGARPRGGHA